jgi:hypothetical protein
VKWPNSQKMWAHFTYPAQARSVVLPFIELSFSVAGSFSELSFNFYFFVTELSSGFLHLVLSTQPDIVFDIEQAGSFDCR